MSGALKIEAAGPRMSVQDMGRPGYSAEGLARGGAMDRLALIEAAALLGLPGPVAGIEMQAMGGTFTVSEPMRIALTGAPMGATLDGRPLRWHAAHPVEPGEVLKIGGAHSGTTGYLTPGGGIATEETLGSRAAHLGAGIGALLQAGETLPTGRDGDPQRPACHIPPDTRFNGGVLRLLDGPQTEVFSEAARRAFCAAEFTQGPRSNRQAMQLLSDDVQGEDTPWFVFAGGLASEPIQAGDIQITGDGTPFVLGAECQTIGGYPRIGSVHPADQGRLVQAGAGARLRFRFVDRDEALAALKSPAEQLRSLRGKVAPLVRNPADIPDLLSYQLISGVTAGDDL